MPILVSGAGHSSWQKLPEMLINKAAKAQDLRATGGRIFSEMCI